MAEEREIDGRGEEKSLMGKGRFLGRENVWGRRKFWEKKSVANWLYYLGKMKKKLGFNLGRPIGKVTCNVEALDWRGCCNVKVCIRLCKACNVKPPRFYACLPPIDGASVTSLRCGLRLADLRLAEFDVVIRWSTIGGVADEVRLQAPVGGVILKES
ncbi:hypothetical protein H5410_016330 [Solanum commersonii]|uniref:Uncharacterized protein n=1 Tax=Solanum commersonii TaxID=4109 RepID=A0A9J5ZX35_SOLCO|nr:hypothetical protein H5410_016330 [Solanum commersonii]